MGKPAAIEEGDGGSGDSVQGVTTPGKVGGTTASAAITSGAAASWAAPPPAKVRNPWRELPESFRKDLTDPLNNAYRKRVAAGPFGKWIAQQKWKGRPPSLTDFDAFAEWRFNHGLALEVDQKDPQKGTPALEYRLRNSLVCVYVMMKNEKSGQDNLWDLVEEIEWVGQTANMLFEPIHDHLKVKQVLEDRYKYADVIFANNPLKKNIWGVRSPVAGTALHFRGPEPDGKNIVEAHIDLHNPGSDWTKAAEHHKKDLKQRDQTHTLDELGKGVKSRGYWLPPFR